MNLEWKRKTVSIWHMQFVEEQSSLMCDSMSGRRKCLILSNVYLKPCSVKLSVHFTRVVPFSPPQSGANLSVNSHVTLKIHLQYMFYSLTPWEQFGKIFVLFWGNLFWLSKRSAQNQVIRERPELYVWGAASKHDFSAFCWFWSSNKPTLYWSHFKSPSLCMVTGHATT